MSSQNKQRKLKNSNGCPSVLKEKGFHMKRRLFFTSAQRQADKKQISED